MNGAGTQRVTDFVLVHGAWGGGWAFDRLVAELRDAGHRVLVAALTGLGDRAAEISPAIDLSTHIGDVVDQIEAAGFDRFVLAGHSYGGMIITGVATRIGARIDALVYIDAFLPQDGQSLWDITGDFEHQHYIDTQKFRPGLVAPIMGAEGDRLTPHPLLTLIEGVRFTGEETKARRHIYIFANAWEPTPFRRFYDAVSNDPAWEVHDVESDHDVMARQPDALRTILLGCVA
jgi:pimeloyl-ACP methyl ester carboxylesterase